MKWSITSSGKQSGLYIIDDFLSSRECTFLKQHAEKRGIPVLWGEGENVLMDFYRHDANKTIQDICKRSSQWMGIPIEYSEPFKVLCYESPGKLFNPHNDYIQVKGDRRSGRIAQILFYLNDLESGGETYFLNMGFKVSPKKGRAVLWYGIQNMAPPEKKGGTAIIPKIFKPNDYSLHTSLPIPPGEKKWIAGLLFHEKKWSGWSDLEGIKDLNTTISKIQ